MINDLEAKILMTVFTSNDDKYTDKLLGTNPKYFSKEMQAAIDIIRKKKIANELIDAGVVLNSIMPEHEVWSVVENTIYLAMDFDGYLKEAVKQYAIATLRNVDTSTNETIIDGIQKVQDELRSDTVNVCQLTMGDIGTDYFKYLEDTTADIKTGWKVFDNTYDIKKKNLVVFCGRPAMAKTAVSLTLCMQLVKRDYKGIFFSLEMSEKEIINRVMTQETAIPMYKLKNLQGFNSLTPAQQGRIGIVSGQLAKLKNKLTFISATLTTNDIRKMATNYKQAYGLDYIVVDYLQLVKPLVKNNNRNVEVAEISMELKRIAVDLDITVFCLAQLSRSVESRPDKHPIMSDLGESGQIERDANVIIGLYREDYYVDDSDRKGILELCGLKNRDGGIGDIDFRFIREIQKVEEI